MDTSKEYVEMCAHFSLWNLWEPKAGDFVYVKEKEEVITLGHDRIGVKKIRESSQPIIEIAYLEEPTQIFKDPCSTTIVEGRNRYYFHRFATVWLPRQDQIQELMRKSMAPLMDFLLFHEFSVWLSKFYDWLCNNCDIAFTSLEKLWLMFFMYSVNELIWNKYEKAWERASIIFRL